MQVVAHIRQLAAAGLSHLYGQQVLPQEVTVNETSSGFSGDYTVVLFAFVKRFKASPDALGQQLGAWMLEAGEGMFTHTEVVKGFLNLTISDAWWLQFLAHTRPDTYGQLPANGQKMMVEYASPNTNKPLHLGHLRNIFLGWSVAEIFKANGFEVNKTCIVNDRGVHICKSMLAWQKFGAGATPGSTGTKGDHFVGDYYVKFENALREEAAPLTEALKTTGTCAGLSPETAAKASLLQGKLADATLPAEKRQEILDELKEIARNATPLMQEVRSMLVLWEQGDEATMDLWRMMNAWVYQGFDATYKRIGADFDKTYYESDTYLLGKQYVEAGLQDGVFFTKEDGSVWIDLTAEGLDEKLVLRKDGTSVYITQDIGLAKKKYEDFPMDQSIYVIGDEQNYHMHVLQLICRRLGMPFAEGIHHLSYGMVDLPSGRMKSREGTVVDADDLCDEMEKVAAAKTEELGKVQDFTETELARLHHTLGMGALKFYLLRVDPKKRMVFNPEESIDFHGFTGPFVQYSYARIQSVLRKAGPLAATEDMGSSLLPLERKLLLQTEQYTGVLQAACAEMNPSLIANYAFQLAKGYNAFYAEHSIANAETAEKKVLRTKLTLLTGQVLAHSLGLLGIQVPDRM